MMTGINDPAWGSTTLGGAACGRTACGRWVTNGIWALRRDVVEDYLEEYVQEEFEVNGKAPDLSHWLERILRSDTVVHRTNIGLVGVDRVVGRFFLSEDKQAMTSIDLRYDQWLDRRTWYLAPPEHADPTDPPWYASGALADSTVDPSLIIMSLRRPAFGTIKNLHKLAAICRQTGERKELDVPETAKEYVTEAAGALTSEGGQINEKASGILAAVYVLLNEDRADEMSDLAEHAQRIGRTREASR